MTMTSGNDELVPLGEGPVATVLAGVDGNDAYALKAYPGPIDRRTRSELDAELRILGELTRRASLLVAGAVEELPDGRCALRMELCAQSLPELVSSFGPLSVPDALALGSALADALAAAHAVGIVHGGVTPGNVLFRASGEPVLADFGLTLRRAFPGDVAATADFLAPETLKDGTHDERTDLYGLGAVLYFALSGSSPHQGRPGEQVDERLLRVLSADVPAVQRDDLPIGLGQLVSSLLAKKPDARPLDAATVASRLGTMIGPGLAAPQFDDFGDVVPQAFPQAFPQAAAPARPLAPAPAPAPPAAPRQAPPSPRQVPPPPRQGPPPAPPGGGFAASPGLSGTPSPAAPGFSGAQPGSAQRQLLVSFGPNDKRRDRPRPGVIIGAVGVLAVIAVVVAVMVTSQPPKVDVPGAPAPVQQAPAPSASPGVPAVTIELDQPVDLGNRVRLTWRSNVPLDFGVEIAPEGRASTVQPVGRANEVELPVDSVLKYCFRIQGYNSQDTWESQAQPFRKATCSD